MNVSIRLLVAWVRVPGCFLGVMTHIPSRLGLRVAVAVFAGACPHTLLITSDVVFSQAPCYGPEKVLSQKRYEGLRRTVWLI